MTGPNRRAGAPRIGFHASHELFAPSALLRAVTLAQQLGFTAAMCSDHFHPWSVRQGQSGFAWSWLGAALAATGLSLGVVCAPGQRYHPAVVAQAAATLGEMYPDRFWLAVGSGEALNESITGDPWPPKPERNARLEEVVAIIRALWAGETVSHDGRVRVREARLYTRPASPPLLLGTALTPETAEWVGRWADGLMTVAGEPEPLGRLVAAFRRGGGTGKPMFCQAALAWDADDATALRAAHELWRHAALDSDVLADLPTPAAFDAATAGVRPEDLRGRLRISADLDRHLDWLRGDLALGFDAVYVYPIARDLETFLRRFAERVLPRLARA